MEQSSTVAPSSLRFDHSQSTQTHVVANHTWWKENQYRVAGALRLVSHGMVITSGAGVGAEASSMRSAAGVVGLMGAGYLTLFGKKEDTNKREVHEAAHTGRAYYAILAASAACLVSSGLLKKRTTETIAGLWTLTWAGYAALMPEQRQHNAKSGSLRFDHSPTAHTPESFVEKEKDRQTTRILTEYSANPKKFTSDMLQLSALFALADGLIHKDVARIISGVCLGASNALLREMRDDDFVKKDKSERAL